jgi:hypothetical protein
MGCILYLWAHTDASWWVFGGLFAAGTVVQGLVEAGKALRKVEGSRHARRS